MPDIPVNFGNMFPFSSFESKVPTQSVRVTVCIFMVNARDLPVLTIALSRYVRTQTNAKEKLNDLTFGVFDVFLPR